MKLFDNNLESTYKLIKPFVTYFGGNRAGATVEMVNAVIKNINYSSGSRLFNATSVSQAAPGPGAVITLSIVAADCDTPSGTCKMCLNNPCETHTLTSISVNETAPGDYIFTIVPSPLNPSTDTYIDSYLKVSNFNTIGSAATVERLSLYTFNVKTYNTLTGIVTSALFKDTIVETILVVGR